jgi:flagellar motor switch protein FliG
MENKDFMSLCVQLYELSEMQRDDLSNLLKSRIFLYEECDGLCFEHLYELSDLELACVVGAVDIEQLAYAQLGISTPLQGKIRGVLSTGQKAELEATIDRIKLARLSIVEKHRDAILGKMQDLVAAGMVEAVSIADPRINQLCTSPSENLPKTAIALSRAILAMDHGSVRGFLKEVRESDLAGALLYMQDARVTRKVMVNLSKARAARLLDDLLDQAYYIKKHAEAKDSHPPANDDCRSNEAACDRFKKVIVELMCCGQISGDFEALDSSI